MDVDENSSQQQSSQNDIDIEQSFLQQFSCLGTTDHDELVGKFQKLLGNQLNYATARFFLDMNNWNLQAAVGCYFDFYSGQRLPSMQIIADVTVGESEGVTPNTKFQQSWKVQNNGDEKWPEGCYLKLTSVPDGQQVYVPAIEPGEATVITVELLSPNEIGSFQTKWRLCTPNGSNFGDTIWAIVQVTPAGTLAITQQLSGLQTNPLVSTVHQQAVQNHQIVPLFSSNVSQNLQLPPPTSPQNQLTLPQQQQNQQPDDEMC